MWQDKLKEIIYILENSDVNEIEVNFWGRKYRVVKQSHQFSDNSSLGKVNIIENKNNQNDEINTDANQNSDSLKGENLLSPMPGTFYSSPSPEDPPFVAIGDIIKGPALAHVASAEGIICVEKIAGLNVETLDYDNIPSCTYCSPEVASVGFNEKSAKELGYDILVGKFPFMASGKANASGHTDGFVKVIFDKKYGEWLGCHMIGYNVTEMIAEVVAARNLETTGHEIIKSVHPHPTMSEAIMEATAAAYDEVIHL